MGCKKKFSAILAGMKFINDWAVFGNLDCNCGPISQKYEFSALAMPLVSETVAPFLRILFIRLPRVFFLLLIIGPKCFHRLYADVLVFSKSSRW